ncbi:hypothetical protein V1509DRAFT_623808 [Lipomyces kononenkoae]
MQQMLLSTFLILTVYAYYPGRDDPNSRESVRECSQAHCLARIFILLFFYYFERLKSIFIMVLCFSLPAFIRYDDYVPMCCFKYAVPLNSGHTSVYDTLENGPNALDSSAVV